MLFTLLILFILIILMYGSDQILTLGFTLSWKHVPNKCKQVDAVIM